MCETSLNDNGAEARPAQPDGGVVIDIPGNYGSTVYDSTGGNRLVAYLCDRCLTDGAREGMVLQMRETQQAPAITVDTWRPHE